MRTQDIENTVPEATHPVALNNAAKDTWLRSSRGGRLLWGLLFITIVAYSIRYGIHSAKMLAYPYQLEYTEGFAMGYAWDWSEGVPLYRSIYQAPYRVMAYVPLFFFLTGVLLKCFGLHFWVGRLVSLLSVLGICLMILLILRKSKVSFASSLLGSGIFLTARYVYRYTQFFRPDTLAIFFVLLGLYLAMFQPRKVMQLLGLSVMIFALFIKQNHIWGILAVLWWVGRTERRRAIILWGYVAVTGAVVLSIGNLLTDGEFIPQVIVYNLKNQFKWSHALALTSLFLAKHSVFFFLIVLSLLRQRRRGRPLGLVHRYFLLTLLSLLMIGKVGSQVHYFLEISASLGLMVPLAVRELLKDERYRLLAKIMPLLLVFEVVTVNMNNAGIATAVEPDAEARRARNELVALLREQPGPLFSEDAGIVVLSGHRLYFDPFLYSQLWHFQLWDDYRICEMLERGEFSAVILEFDIFKPETIKWHRYRFTPAILEQIKRSYRLVEVFDTLHLYRYAPQ